MEFLLGCGDPCNPNTVGLRSFIASGAIPAAGAAVTINPDGTVSEVGVGDVAPGVFGAFGTDFSSSIGMLRDGPRYVATWQDGTNVDYRLALATVGPTAVTYGANYTMSASGVQSAKAVPVAAGGFIAAYSTVSQPNKLQLQYIAWNGLAYAIAGTLSFSATNVTSFDIAIDESDQYYVTYSSGGVQYEFAGAVVGGLLQASTPTVANATAYTLSKVFASGAGNKILHVFHSGGAAFYRVITTAAGNVFSATATNVFDTAVNQIYGDAKSGSILLSYNKGGVDSYLRWADLDGTGDTIGAAQTVNNGAATPITPMVIMGGTSDGVFVYPNMTAAGWVRSGDGVATTSMTTQFGQRTGVNPPAGLGGFAVGSQYIFAYSGIKSGSATHAPDGATVSFVVSTDDVDGFAQAAVANGESVEVALESQISAVHTGLTPGEPYYLQNGYITATDTGRFAGTAISATELLVHVEGGQNTGQAISGAVIDNTFTDPLQLSVGGRYIVPTETVGVVLAGEFVGHGGEYAEWDGITVDINGTPTGFLFYPAVEGETIQVTTGVNAGQVWAYELGVWARVAQTTSLPISNYDITKPYELYDLVIKDGAIWQANAAIAEGTVFVQGSSGATWTQISYTAITPSRIFMRATAVQNNVNANTDIAFQVADSVKGTDISFSTVTNRFTLKAGKTYKLTGIIPFVQNNWADFQWHNGSVFVGSIGHQEHVTSSTSVGGGTGICVAFVTPVVDSLYTLRCLRQGGTVIVGDPFAGGAKSSAYVETLDTQVQIAGVTAMHSAVSRITTSQTITGINQAILWNNVESGNIDYESATGIWTLEAGRTYDLQAAVDHDGAAGTGVIEFRFYNITAAAYIGSWGLCESLNNNTAWGPQPTAQATITPTQQTRVSVRVSARAVSSVIRAGCSWAKIREIGATATSTVPLALVSDINAKAQYNVPINGDTLRFNSTTGKWETSVSQGTANNLAWYSTPWGLSFRVDGTTEHQFFIRNSGSAVIYLMTECSYITFGGASGRSGWATTLAVGASRTLWTDNSINFNEIADTERAVIRYATDRTQLSLGNYQEIEVTCIVSSGWNNNHYHVRKLR